LCFKNEQKSERNISGILQFTISLELSFIFPFDEWIFRVANLWRMCVGIKWKFNENITLEKKVVVMTNLKPNGIVEKNRESDFKFFVNYNTKNQNIK
jgi:hypothetical protein